MSNPYKRSIHVFKNTPKVIASTVRIPQPKSTCKVVVYLDPPSKCVKLVPKYWSFWMTDCDRSIPHPLFTPTPLKNWCEKKNKRFTKQNTASSPLLLRFRLMVAERFLSAFGLKYSFVSSKLHIADNCFKSFHSKNIPRFTLLGA